MCIQRTNSITFEIPSNPRQTYQDLPQRCERMAPKVNTTNNDYHEIQIKLWTHV